jgi:hypothetical protein
MWGRYNIRMTMLPTAHTAHQFLHLQQWSNLETDAFGYILGLLSKGDLPKKLWLMVPHEEDIPPLMDCLQFWIQNNRNILYYPADDPDVLDGISLVRTVSQRRLFTL